MYRVPDWVLNSLNSVTKRRMKVEYSNDRFKTVIDEIDVYDSDWTCDLSSQVRWSGSASAYRLDDLVNNKTTWMRAFLYVKGVRSTWTKIPMGVYRVYKVKRSGDFATITLDGLEAVVRDHTFHVPRTFPISKGDSRRRTLEKLIRESIPDAKIQWLVREATPKMEKVTIERERWELIDGDLSSKSITNSLAADCFVDRVGQFVVAPTPIESQDPVWSITVDSGVKVSSETELSREGMKNVWSVWADPGNGKKIIGPAHVWDNDPDSDTYAGKNPIKYGARDTKTGFGIVPGRYQNPLMKTERECAKVGRKRLALSLAVRRDVTVTSIFNPTLDGGDCVTTVPDGSDHEEPFIIENVKYSIDDASTELKMRTQGPPAFSEVAEEGETPA